MNSENCLEFLRECARPLPLQQAQPRCRTCQCSVDKLDKDFLLFVGFAFDCLEKLKHSEHLESCKLWFTKLCSEHYTTLCTKRTRNLYLSKLILNIQDGKFNTIFLTPPAPEQGFLPICEISLCRTKPCVSHATSPGCEFISHALDMKDYTYRSEDTRTYVATKEIPGGAMCYVAVSVGGESPQFVDRNGERVRFPQNNFASFPRRGDMRAKYSDEKGSVRERKKRILARRRPREDRDRLIFFYDEILSRIDVELAELSCKTCVQNTDPFIDQLARKLQNSVVSQSSDTVESINKAVGKRKVLLTLLRNNIEAQKKNIFEKREVLLSRIERAIEVEDREVQSKSEFQFIKPSTHVTCSVEDFKSTIWGTILQEPMHPKHICLLKRKYCFQLVTVLQSLLREDRVAIINQANTLARDIEAQMMRDLQDEIQNGLTRFSTARQEWVRIQKVLKDIEKARSDIVRQKLECKCYYKGCTKENVLDCYAQVNNMKLKLECVNKRNEDLIKNIKIIHGKIHCVRQQKVGCQDELNGEYEKLKFCVSEKRNDIREQETAIATFKKGK